MQSDRPASNISRRVLISSMALLPALSGMPLTAIAQTQATPDNMLGSWNDGPAKQAILDFVKATTDRASPKFVPPEERIATFDQDGTLWVEHPIYSQVVYCLDRVPAVVEQDPKLRNVEPFKTVLSGNRDEYTGAGDGARLMMLVLHDDAKREYAYGPAQGLPASKVGTFTQALYDEAKKKGWTVISMKDDWKRIFAFEQNA
jgi:hypothetical protein